MPDATTNPCPGPEGDPRATSSPHPAASTINIRAATSAAAHHTLRPGTRLGRYQIVRVIGSGGMGVVYEATQETPRRPVAIKVMRFLSPGAPQRRFRAEAEALARLSHPAIVQVFEAGCQHITAHGDTPDATLGAQARVPLDYIAMELVPGATPLCDHARRERLDLRQRVELILPILDALAHAHERGIVHRDLKPANIVVGTDGRARLIDFGIARREWQSPHAQSTRTGQLIGTLAYMSPEQAGARRGSVDWRTDIYAMGLVLHELLTGSLPYAATPSDDLLDLARIIRDSRPILASREDVPSEPLPEPLGRVILNALAKERDERYLSARAMRDDLLAFLEGREVLARGDSPLRILRSRARFAAARRPLTCALAALLCAAGVGLLALPLARESLEIFTQRLARPLADPPVEFDAFRHVRLVVVQDSTDIEALARSEFLAGVSRDRVTSSRLLYARLLETLSRAGARVVAFDIMFKDQTEFDTLLLSHADLRPGTATVFGVSPWSRVARPVGRTRATAATPPRVGGLTMNISPDKHFDVELAVFKPDAPLASLSLEALAAYQSPTTSPRIAPTRVDQPGAAHGRVVLRPGGDSPALLIDTSGILREDAQTATPERGVAVGDAVAFLPAEIPAQSAIDSATLDIAQVVGAEPAKLRELFAGQAVIVADWRDQADIHDYADGRRLSGSLAHASALESLIRAYALTRDARADAATDLLASAAGILACALPRRTRTSRASAMLVCVLAAVAPAALLALWTHLDLPTIIPSLGAGILVNPLGPVAAALAAAALSRWVGLRRTS